MDPNSFDDKCESRLYIGNLDLKITELYQRTSYGILVGQGEESHEALLLSSIVPKSEHAGTKLAKEKMQGRLACGRPLVVRLASEKCVEEAPQNSTKVVCEVFKTSLACGTSGHMNRSAKIAAIKNKLKSLEEERSRSKLTAFLVTVVLSIYPTKDDSSKSR